MKKRLLVCCEESQRVCMAFRDRGWEAYSCDIEPCSGGHPEWHICQDVIPLINGNCEFDTVDGVHHVVDGKWDLLICHPPCTYLCLSGQQHCNEDRFGEKAIQRQKDREDAVNFFMQFVNADCEHIAVENPVGIMTSRYRKADQYIQPYQFGSPASKKTGLWLKSLPNLVPTNIVNKEYHISGTGRKWDKWFWDTSCISNLTERSKARSKTFEGIALAMADQWGSYIENE